MGIKAPEAVRPTLRVAVCTVAFAHDEKIAGVDRSDIFVSIISENVTLPAVLSVFAISICIGIVACICHVLHRIPASSSKRIVSLPLTSDKTRW
jgi:hypothetical protein